MTTPKRRIKRGRITHVSLCRRAMNQLPVLMKSGDRVQIELLTKVQPEGLLHALVYVPEENGAVDGEGDVAPAKVIKQLAHDFLANGGNIDIEHNLQTLGPDKIRVAETFLVQKGDQRFADWKDYQNRPVNAEGSWALILKVLDPELRGAVERGELNGVSMFGQAEVEILGKASTTKTTTNMTNEEMQALCEMLTKSLASALKPPASQSAPVPQIPFEGDPLNPEDLAKHMDKVLFASLDLSKPADIAKWQGHVAKRQSQIAAASETDEQKLAKAQAELKKAQDALAKLQKGSNAPVNTKPEDGGEPQVGLAKSEQDQMKAGRDAMKKFQGRGK
jgi:hypothetical protein